MKKRRVYEEEGDEEEERRDEDLRENRFEVDEEEGGELCIFFHSQPSATKQNQNNKYKSPKFSVRELRILGGGCSVHILYSGTVERWRTGYEHVA